MNRYLQGNPIIFGATKCTDYSELFPTTSSTNLTSSMRSFTFINFDEYCRFSIPELSIESSLLLEIKRLQKLINKRKNVTTIELELKQLQKKLRDCKK